MCHSLPQLQHALPPCEAPAKHIEGFSALLDFTPPLQTSASLRQGHPLQVLALSPEVLARRSPLPPSHLGLGNKAGTRHWLCPPVSAAPSSHRQCSRGAEGIFQDSVGWREWPLEFGGASPPGDSGVARGCCRPWHRGEVEQELLPHPPQGQQQWETPTTAFPWGLVTSL